MRSATTTDLAGEEIHRLGLELVARFSARADAILKARGLTQGPVGARIAALRRDPANLYPNDDAGRAALLADLEAKTQAMRERLPGYFGRLPKAGVKIQRIPPSIESGAPDTGARGAPTLGAVETGDIVDDRSGTWWTPAGGCPDALVSEVRGGSA